MLLGTSPLNEDPTCHCVPILDVFEDDANANVSYIVMPFLRNYCNPPFECVEDVLDFGEQLLEVSMVDLTRLAWLIYHVNAIQGLTYLHKHGVAHRYFILLRHIWPS